MSLTFVLPWFPIVLAVAVAGRLLGRERGLPVGVMCALFWIVLVSASEGPGIWQDAWAVLALLAGGCAIAAVGAWAAAQQPQVAGALGGGRGGSALADGCEAAQPVLSVRSVSSGESTDTGGRWSGEGATPALAAIAEQVQRFDDWLEPYRKVRSGDPWAEFGEFVRTALYQCCRATRVRPYALVEGEPELVALRANDPWAADVRISAREGILGYAVTSGRMYVAGDPMHGKYLASLGEEAPPAAGPIQWCFPVLQGSQRLGAVAVGHLELVPNAHRALLEASAGLIGQCWGLLLETLCSRRAMHEDPLSGLYTREAFLQLAEQTLRQSYAQARPTAVAVLAIEGLRALNDSGRWDVADELLAEVGAALGEKVRAADCVGRFDDSRFALMLGGVDTELAALIVDQVLGRLAAVVEDRERWGAALDVRCGLTGSGTGRPALRRLVSGALAQCSRARIENLRVATDLPAGAAAARRGEGRYVKIERQQVGTVDVFAPIGALVDQDAENFCKALLSRLKSANPRVVVAMREVPYMDSGALEGLLAATDELSDRAVSLRLASVTPACREILEMTGLSGRFRFFEDVQDAVRSFL